MFYCLYSDLPRQTTKNLRFQCIREIKHTKQIEQHRYDKELINGIGDYSNANSVKQTVVGGVY